LLPVFRSFVSFSASMRNRTPDQNNNLVQPGPLLPCDVPEQFHLELRNIIAALVCLLTAMGEESGRIRTRFR